MTFFSCVHPWIVHTWCVCSIACNRLDVEQYKDVQAEGFLEKYTSLVQRLSLLLLQVGILACGAAHTLCPVPSLLSCLSC